MKNFSLFSKLLLSCIVMGSAQAQFIGGLTVNPQTVKVGEPVTVTATVDVVNNNYCGFIVFFGDGRSVESVSDVSKTGPFIFTHAYDKAGEYKLSMGGRHVQSHPNCAGADKFATVTVTGKSRATASAKTDGLCPSGWRLMAKSHNSKTGAFTCLAQPGTALPNPQPQCRGDLTYFENAKKGQFGCRP